MLTALEILRVIVGLALVIAVCYYHPAWAWLVLEIVAEVMTNGS